MHDIFIYLSPVKISITITDNFSISISLLTHLCDLASNTSCTINSKKIHQTGREKNAFMRIIPHKYSSQINISLYSLCKTNKYKKFETLRKLETRSGYEKCKAELTVNNIRSTQLRSKMELENNERRKVEEPLTEMITKLIRYNEICLTRTASLTAGLVNKIFYFGYLYICFAVSYLPIISLWSPFNL